MTKFEKKRVQCEVLERVHADLESTRGFFYTTPSEWYDDTEYYDELIKRNEYANMVLDEVVKALEKML